MKRQTYTHEIKERAVRMLIEAAGDSYDNALAETVNGLCKSEVIHYLKKSWNGVNDVEEVNSAIEMIVAKVKKLK